MKNLHEFYTVTCRKFSDRILFDKKITYAQAHRLAEDRAAFLQKNGVRKGQTVAILASNSYDWLITYMGITMCGAIVLALDPNLPNREYGRILKEVKCKYAFISPEHRNRLKGVKSWIIDIDLQAKSSLEFKEVKLNETDIAS